MRRGVISWMRDNTDEIMSACDDPAVGSGMRLSDLIRSCYNMDAVKKTTSARGRHIQVSPYFSTLIHTSLLALMLARRFERPFVKLSLTPLLYERLFVMLSLTPLSSV